MKTLDHLHHLHSQKGQGVTEYILVLFVSILIVLGGVYQVNDAFKNWATNYFGEYLACLLETGELPAIGGSAGAAAGLCDQSFQPFTLSDGRPLIGPPIGAGGGASSGSNRDETGRAIGNENGDSTGVARSSGSGAGSRQGSRFRPNSAGSGAGGSGSINSNEDGNKSKSGGDGLLNVSTNSQGRDTQRVPVSVAGSFSDTLGSGQKKEDDKKKELTKKTTTEKEKANRSALIKVAPPINRASEIPEIEEYTFGSFLRYLIMAAILIALLLLMAGQALQIGKSMDSN